MSVPGPAPRGDDAAPSRDHPAPGADESQLGREPSPWAPREDPGVPSSADPGHRADAGAGAWRGAGGPTGSAPGSEDPPGAPGGEPAPGPLLGHSGPGFPEGAPAPLLGRAREPRRRWRSARALALVASCLLVGLLGGVAGQRLAGPAGTTVSVVDRSGGGAAQPADGSVTQVADAVLPSTVSVEISSSEGSGNGSGFVLSEDGYVVTNNHVIAPAVEAAGRIRVLLSDGTREPATVVGRTADYDLAVLRIDRTGLVPLAFADTSAVRVGDPVVAVGAPLGLASTVTSGIVSALNRPVVAGPSQGEQGFINAVQTDAAINPGNSGGPLVDLTGAVVGVNSAIAQTAALGAGGSIGLGFAIPADQVVRTTTELIEDGVATYPVIGVSLDSTYEGQGVRVAQGSSPAGAPVVAGGPADLAGVEPGDVITAIDDQLVTAPDELIVAIRARTPGEEVVLTVRRGREAVEIPVELGSEPSD
ncbi:S1C family serine protease [uncultured Pseudokineococcus sp.]|uniref:S1C family serine protease n=1 Tax=uncultured Pseudokineococcus sp. TaxID=1642928 RepID=UPI0026376EB5|nr:trypsin-like peptidase domain-containing protein [uncultured Pseudokineococcus sp.]